MGMTYELSRLYELWYEFLCKLTWWTQKGMRYKGVWVIRAMGYEGVNCTYFQNPHFCQSFCRFWVSSMSALWISKKYQGKVDSSSLQLLCSWDKASCISTSVVSQFTCASIKKCKKAWKWEVGKITGTVAISYGGQHGLLLRVPRSDLFVICWGVKHQADCEK